MDARLMGIGFRTTEPTRVAFASFYSPALSSIMATTNISKKRKIIADGVFYAELNELLTRELGEDGYSGVEVRVTPLRTEIIIRATRTQVSA